MTEQSVFDAALSLPERARAHLVEVLLASLPDDPVAAPDELPRAWLEEIRRRRQETEGGKVELVSGEDVMNRLRQRTG